MIDFRDATCAELGLKLLVHTNHAAVKAGANPFDLGTSKCCGLLKTRALLDALRENRIDAAVGVRHAAKRERSRAKRADLLVSRRPWTVGSRNQRPELWNLYNGRLDAGESMRVFPLSNWTGASTFGAGIEREQIPVVPLYFAKQRKVLVRGEMLIPVEHDPPLRGAGEAPQNVACRMRTLGCTCCSGAVRSGADTISAKSSRIGAGGAIGTGTPDHRSRSRRVDGTKKTSRLLLNGRTGITPISDRWQR